MTETFYFPIPIDVDENMMKGMFLSDVSINTVLISYHDESLKVLLLRLSTSGHYMIPGGFIKKEEDIEAAAIRTLKEMTGLDEIYLEQFYVAGNARRTNDPKALEALNRFGLKKIENWISRRKISICYYALLNNIDLNIIVNEAIFSDVHWAAVDKLPPMLFDHEMIIQKAVNRLQDDIDRRVIPAYLLDETFTMPELQKLYEAVYQQKLTRSNFQRRMLNLNILERIGKKYDGGSHKAPYLYRFKTSKIETDLI